MPRPSQTGGLSEGCNPTENADAALDGAPPRQKVRSVCSPLFRFFHLPIPPKQAISVSAFIQPTSLIDFLSRQDGE